MKGSEKTSENPIAKPDSRRYSIQVFTVAGIPTMFYLDRSYRFVAGRLAIESFQEERHVDCGKGHG